MPKKTHVNLNAKKKISREFECQKNSREFECQKKNSREFECQKNSREYIKL